MARSACAGMVQPKKGDPKPCAKTGVIDVDGALYCGIHAESTGLRLRKQRQEATRREDMNRRVTEFLEWTKDHPSVWDNPHG